VTWRYHPPSVMFRLMVVSLTRSIGDSMTVDTDGRIRRRVRNDVAKRDGSNHRAETAISARDYIPSSPSLFPRVHFRRVGERKTDGSLENSRLSAMHIPIFMYSSGTSRLPGNYRLRIATCQVHKDASLSLLAATRVHHQLYQLHLPRIYRSRNVHESLFLLRDRSRYSDMLGGQMPCVLSKRALTDARYVLVHPEELWRIVKALSHDSRKLYLVLS